jgi:hypothetical protein
VSFFYQNNYFRELRISKGTYYVIILEIHCRVQV